MTERKCTVENCLRRHYAKGLCKRHYGRVQYHGSTDRLQSGLKAKPLRDRIDAQTDRTGDCWIWIGAMHTSGYGKVGAGGDGGATLLAHRASYELSVGPIPEGHQIDHLCRNRACVKPQHLEPVPALINMRRMNAACGIGSAKIECPKGHPYSEENTSHRNGRRHCKTCARDRARRNYQPRKVSA